MTFCTWEPLVLSSSMFVARDWSGLLFVALCSSHARLGCDAVVQLETLVKISNLQNILLNNQKYKQYLLRKHWLSKPVKWVTRSVEVFMELVKSESIHVYILHKYNIDVMKRLICSSVKSDKLFLFFFCEGIATSTIRREQGYSFGSQNKVHFHKRRYYTVLQSVLRCS